MKVLIRPYLDSDFEVLFALRNNMELQYLLLTHPRPNTKQQTIDWLVGKSKGPDSSFFVISDDANNTIGYIQATNIHLLNRTCYIGVVIDQKWQGMKIFSQAEQLVVNYLMKSFGIKKILAEIRADNLNSIKAFKNAGYIIAAQFLDHYSCGSHSFDVLVFEKKVI